MKAMIDGVIYDSERAVKLFDFCGADGRRYQLCINSERHKLFAIVSSGGVIADAKIIADKSGIYRILRMFN